MEPTDPQTGMHLLEADECWQLLRRHEVGRLATAVRNRPDIFPVNYAIDGEHIVINTAPGTKLAAAVLGRAVAFEVDALDPETKTGWSVVVKGTAREIEDLEGLMDAEALGIESWADFDKNRFMRIDPSAITGRRL